MKTTAITILLITLTTASHAQSYKINVTSPGYDNINHDRQREQQLNPSSAAIPTQPGTEAYLPAPISNPPLMKLSYTSSTDMLNDQKIKVVQLHNYTGIMHKSE
jgi:hypothetical protein